MLSEVEISKKYETLRKHCGRNMLLPYEYEWTGFSSGYNVFKRKHELSKIQQKSNLYQSIGMCRTQNIMHMCRFI